MGPAVYLLCAATALVCAVLLLRAYARSHARLLLWAGICFLGLTLNNGLVFVDLVLVPSLDLFTWRNVAALAAVGTLIYGLIWDVR